MTVEPEAARRSAGFQRVAQALRERGHAQAPRWLDTPARTCADAARALGVAEGQIAKSVIFRRVADGRAVLVVCSGDRRVDVAKVAACVGEVAAADAAFTKARTGFSIGGVAPLAHAHAPVVLLDRDLGRFATVWAAAGHPNGVFEVAPAQLAGWLGVAPADIALDGEAAR